MHVLHTHTHTFYCKELKRTSTYPGGHVFSDSAFLIQWWRNLMVDSGHLGGTLVASYSIANWTAAIMRKKEKTCLYFSELE